MRLPWVWDAPDGRRLGALAGGISGKERKGIRATVQQDFTHGKQLCRQRQGTSYEQTLRAGQGFWLVGSNKGGSGGKGKRTEIKISESARSQHRV
jgi:hypothetical protein